MYRLFFFIFILGSHQFHISQCTVSFLKKEQKVAVKLHIFIDDLELVLKNEGAVNVSLSTQKDLKIVSKYIKKKISIFINNQVCEMVFVSNKITDDGKAIWCNFEIQNVKNLQTMTIRNEILLDLYEDQKNITKVVDESGKTQHFMFEKGHIDAGFSF